MAEGGVVEEEALDADDEVENVDYYEGYVEEGPEVLGLCWVSACGGSTLEVVLACTCHPCSSIDAHSSNTHPAAYTRKHTSAVLSDGSALVIMHRQ